MKKAVRMQSEVNAGLHALYNNSLRHECACVCGQFEVAAAPAGCEAALATVLSAECVQFLTALAAESREDVTSVRELPPLATSAGGAVACVCSAVLILLVCPALLAETPAAGAGVELGMASWRAG